MFENDFIMREIESMTKFLGNVIFNKRTSDEIVDEQGIIDGQLLMKRILQDKIYKLHINEAENDVFDLISVEKSPENLEIAIWFYNKLNELTDEQLKTANFSREEIEDGMIDIIEIFKNENIAQNNLD